MLPLVSIIMPAYNAQFFISESIKSVLSQTYQNWELIIVDDGSTDDTVNICRQFQALDTRIKYFYQPNGKQGKARSNGVLKSTGTVLAFLDADDLWLPEKLEISVKIYSEGDHDLLFTDAYIFTSANKITNTNGLSKLGVCSAIYKGKKGLAEFLYKNKIPMLTVLVKKQAVLAVGNFSARSVAEDYELWLKLLNAGYVFKGSNVCLSIYRVHPDATTAKDKIAVQEVAQMFTDFFKDKPEQKKRYYRQIKTWFKRYLQIHYLSKEKELQLPSIFQDFTTSMYKYKWLFGAKKNLPHWVYNFLYRLV